MPKPTINVLCDLVRRKSYLDAYNFDSNLLQLSCDQNRGNVYLRLNQIETFLDAPLSDLSRDLGEVAAYVYQADKGLRRGEGSDWTREISMLVPVRALSTWQKLRECLSRVLFELTGDVFNFYFVQRQGRDRHYIDSGQKSQTPTSDCVCLFSGGLDGFAGVTQLANRRRKPILVSHYISNLKPIQQRQVEAFNKTFAFELEHLQFRVAPLNNVNTFQPFVTKENTQRPRSFLYLSMAALVAFERGLKDIFVCENGVLAINVPMTASRLGSRSTRSTHPHFLQPFQDFIRKRFTTDLTIRNPFSFKTKKEVVQVVKRLALKKELRHTISCWGFPRRTMNVPNTNHCGYCLPCIHRRISFVAAGYEYWDDNYKIDIFREYNRVNRQVALDFRDLLTFAAKVNGMSKADLIYSNPALLVEVGELCNTGGKDDSDLLAQMLKRYSAEVLGVAKSRARGALKYWQIPI
jgi:7-cyano-7-deazaguanine synthase in queuosine biosynthesis